LFNDGRDIVALGWLCFLVFDLQSCFLETTSNIQRYKMKAGNTNELKTPLWFGLYLLDVNVTILHFKTVAFSCMLNCLQWRCNINFSCAFPVFTAREALRGTSGALRLQGEKIRFLKGSSFSQSLSDY